MNYTPDGRLTVDGTGAIVSWANGIPYTANGRIAVSGTEFGQIYQGTWDASSNTPDLTTVESAGHYYVVTTGGTFNAVTYAPGDWIISNGTNWEKYTPPDATQNAANEILKDATLRLNYADNRYRVYEGLAGMADKTFAEAQTFTRGSDATGITATGRLATVGSNLPRLVGNRGGLLIEGAATNLFWWSDELDNAWWNSSSGSTVSPNITTGPDGNNTADMLVEDTSTGEHYRGRTSNILSAGVRNTISINAKKAGRDAAIFVTNRDGQSARVRLNLSTGATTTVVGNAGLVVHPAEKRADGWWRFSITVDGGTGATTSLIVILTSNGTTENYAGDGVSGIYLGRRQLEVGSNPTSDIKTEGAQATRAADVCSRTLGSEYRADEGTLLFEFVPNYFLAGSNNWVIGGSDNTVNNLLGFSLQGNKYRATCLGGAYGGPDVSYGARAILLLTWKNGISSFYVNGLKVGDASYSGNPALISRLQIGGLNSGIEFRSAINAMNLALIPRKVSEAEAIALTTL